MLVGRKSNESDKLLIAPGDPNGSYLMDKLLGSKAMKEDLMPLGDDPLSADNLKLVKDWIASIPGEKAAAAAVPAPSAAVAAPDPALEAKAQAVFDEYCTTCHAEGGSLDDAEAAAQLVLQRAGTRPVSLIVYAGEAYVATAFTTDPAALGSIVAVLDGETVPDPGSRSDRALALARRTLEEAQILRADVVLVTDGEGLGPAAFDEVTALRADGAFVSAIHVAPSQRPGDMPPPDPAGLERLAAAGEGFFADATTPLAVADGIGRRRSDALAEGDYAVLHYTDYGRYLLVLALFPALALFRRSV